MRLFGISLENTTGAVVDNLGIVSVQREELRARRRRRTVDASSSIAARI